MTWEFGWSEVIAIGAVVVAAASWIDSRLRINAAAVQFALEPAEPEFDRYKLRNTGTKTARWVSVDPASVMEWQASGGNTIRLRPQESVDLYLSKGNTLGVEWPDEIVVRFGRRGRGERVIVFPQPDAPARGE